MSTGAECRFTEVAPGVWQYWIQDWPYGDWNQGQTHGPFKTVTEAIEHMSEHYPNPGGWSTRVHVNHVHDMVMLTSTGKVVCRGCEEEMNNAES